MTNMISAPCPTACMERAGCCSRPRRGLDVALPLQENEALLGSEMLNLDANRMKGNAVSPDHDIGRADLRYSTSCIVCTRGKMHNPATNSWGVLVGSSSDR